MRFRDLLGIALSALWQQKVRTVLTTLGVVFGTFVLVTSLSVNQGVQETIVREYSRHGELRQIRVFRGSQTGTPAVDTAVEGNMSDSRRERLRQELQRREGVIPAEQVVHLTPERLQALARLDHVTTVNTLIHATGRVELHGQKRDAVTIGFPPDRKGLARRIVAGAILPARDGRAVLVSELLLYRLGVRDDDAVEKVVGQEVHIAFGIERGQSLTLFQLFNAGRARADIEHLDLFAKIARELPTAIDSMKHLTAEEKQRFRDLLQAPQKKPKQPILTFVETFTIVGVIRGTNKDDERDWHDYWAAEADVILPVQTAEELFFRDEANRQFGADHATVQVDSWENVKEVNEQIKAMGLETHALVEYLEREQLMYLLIFGAMTCVAFVALLVAGLSIANIMLISVLERTREVGIMKAVGARDRHIQLIFLVEGALIGALGGLCGVLLSWAHSYPADAWVRSLVTSHLRFDLQESLFVFPLWLVLSAPLFACLVTTVAAVYPAWRAARVNPITALRHE